MLFCYETGEIFSSVQLVQSTLFSSNVATDTVGEFKVNIIPVSSSSNLAPGTLGVSCGNESIN